MNRRYLLRTILLLGIVAMSGLLIWRYYQAQRIPVPLPQVEAPRPRPRNIPVEHPKPQDDVIAPAPLKKGARSFYGQLPKGVRDIRQLRMVNKPSPTWRKKVESHLKRLGGQDLKTLELTPEESYIIPDGDAGRYVERVSVKLTSKKGDYTSFFAEVDAETGYVMKTWGAAIPERTRHSH
jgi:hypothetical protein